MNPWRRPLVSPTPVWAKAAAGMSVAITVANNGLNSLPVMILVLPHSRRCLWEDYCHTCPYDEIDRKSHAGVWPQSDRQALAILTPVMAATILSLSPHQLRHTQKTGEEPP